MKNNISSNHHRALPSFQPNTVHRAGFIFFVSLTLPILLLVQAWRTKSPRYKHLLLTAFVTIYGATISIRYDPTGQGSDGVRHLLLVYEHYVGLTFSEFISDLWNTLSLQLASNPGIRDPYKHIVSYLVGGVFGMPWLFFTIIAFVYGYFFTGSMLEIFKYFRNSKFNYVIIGFATLLFLLKNIEGVNTVRTWTGLWILVYACLRYYDTKKMRYILLMLAPPFVHFGYLIMVLPALVVLLFGNRMGLYAILFVASSFTNLIPQGPVMESMAITERGINQAQDYYLEHQLETEEVMRQASSQGNRWYRVFQQAGIQKWGLNILVYTVLLSGVCFGCMNYQQRALFSIGLLTLTLSNSIWFLYAVSNRSWTIGCVFILAAYILANTQAETRERILEHVPPYYKWGLHLSLLLFFPYLLYNLSVILDFPSIFLLVAPFVVWVDPEINMSIKYVLQILLGVR